MLLFLGLCKIDFAPRPKSLKEKSQSFRVAQLSLSCKYLQSDECPYHIKDAFEFYGKLAFSRQAPYTLEEYDQNFSYKPTITGLRVEITYDQEFALQPDYEHYRLAIESSQVVIRAESSFGAIRGMASFAFLPDLAAVQAADERYYEMPDVEIDDKPEHVFRAYTLDAAGKFVKLDTIRRTIDAISIYKLNILIFKCGGAKHLPIRFTGEKTAQLVDGSFSPFHYYDLEDLSALQQYARSRGVVIVPELTMPGGAGPFWKVKQEFTADCPLAAKQNYYSIALNPLNSEVITVIAEAYKELYQAFFPSNINARPILHLSGEMPSIECWKADAQIQKYAKAKMIDLDKLHFYFYEQLFAQLQDLNCTYIVNEDVLQMDLTSVAKDLIVHFTKTTARSIANAKNVRQVYSTGYGLHEMHPNGGYHYFYQDTWMDLHRSPSAGSYAGLGIGGSLEMPAENCWDESCMYHAFDRGITVAEAFWTSAASDTRRLQNTGCKIYKAVGFSGPLDIGQPCLGY